MADKNSNDKTEPTRDTNAEIEALKAELAAAKAELAAAEKQNDAYEKAAGKPLRIGMPTKLKKVNSRDYEAGTVRTVDKGINIIDS